MENRKHNSLGLFNYLLFASLIVLILIILSGSVFSARARVSKEVVPAQTTSERERQPALQVELITITRTGFEPTELTVPAGKFLLDVDNRSEIAEVELRLDRQEGGREVTTTVRSRAPEWRGELDLRPGVYILSEANHPRWICRITITSETRTGGRE